MAAAAASPSPLDDLPVIDFDLFLRRADGWQEECAKVVACLERYGILVVKEPVLSVAEIIVAS